MPTKKQIEIIVETDGSTQIEGHGFKGGLCEKATKFLEVALGMVTKRKAKKDRFKMGQARVVNH